MGAKLSKKKKSYCLGAGKDGESTETTEVEQKETENQDGEKDATEPNGEKPSTDQAEANCTNDEQALESEKQPNGEMISGESTKDDSSADQKETNTSAKEEEGKASECSQVESENTEVCPNATQEQAGEEKKERPHSVQETQKNVEGSDLSCAPQDTLVQEQNVKACKETEHHEEKDPVQETVATVTKQEPSQESKPVDEQESKPVIEEPEQTNSVSDHVPEAVTQKDIENVPTLAQVPESEQSKPEAEQDALPVLEVAKSEQPQESIPEFAVEKTAQPLTPVIVLSKPELIPECETVPEPDVAESVNAVTVASTESEPLPAQLSERECGTESKKEDEPLAETLPLESNDVSEQTCLAENIVNVEFSGCGSLDTDILNAQVHIEVHPPEVTSEEHTPKEENTVTQNGPTEQLAPEIQQEKTKDEQQDLQLGQENETKEQNILASQQDGPVTEDYKVELDSELAKQENNEDVCNLENVTNLAPELPTTEVHDQEVHAPSEDGSHNPTKSDEELGIEKVCSATPQTNDKHVITNGLHNKEEMMVKEKLENGSDDAFSDLNGQTNEIACNE
ncbi:uncharacterized protein RCH25_049284 [Pelodytes ibericus]